MGIKTDAKEHPNSTKMLLIKCATGCWWLLGLSETCFNNCLYLSVAKSMMPLFLSTTKSPEGTIITIKVLTQLSSSKPPTHYLLKGCDFIIVVIMDIHHNIACISTDKKQVPTHIRCCLFMDGILWTNTQSNVIAINSFFPCKTWCRCPVPILLPLHFSVFRIWSEPLYSDLHWRDLLLWCIACGLSKRLVCFFPGRL